MPTRTNVCYRGEPLPRGKVRDKFLYRLRCPLTDAIRYVGLCRNPADRFVEHCKGWTKSTASWCECLRKDGLKPAMEIVVHFRAATMYGECCWRMVRIAQAAEESEIKRVAAENAKSGAPYLLNITHNPFIS